MSKIRWNRIQEGLASKCGRYEIKRVENEDNLAGHFRVWSMLTDTKRKRSEPQLIGLFYRQWQAKDFVAELKENHE